MSAAEKTVYLDVRQKIIDGVFRGGTHLTTEALAETLGVSRTPVREALRRLQAEGLVQIIANRGAFVSSWTVADIDEVFDLRNMLEAHATRLAARNITAATLDRLEELASLMDAAVEQRTPQWLDRLTQHNTEFHHLIMQAANHRRLDLVLGQIVQIPLVMRTFAIYSDEELSRSMQHHREMIAAFREGDGDWAASVMKSHLFAAHHVLRRTLATIDGSDLPPLEPKTMTANKNPRRRNKQTQE